MKTEYKVIVLSILLGLFLWVAGAALDYFIYYQGTFWGLLIYEIPAHEIYVRTLVLGCCVIFGVAISTVFGKFRRAEEKQQESEKQLRLAVKNSRDVLYKLNLRTGDFDYVSPSVVELGGYTPQGFILLGVKGLLRRIHAEDRHRFMMHFRNVLRLAVEDGLAPTIEYRWKHKEGEYRWFSDNRAVIRDGDGNAVSLIGSVRDVTVQKEAEKALGESEKKYRTLIETAQEGIGITSPGEELVFVNKAFASILGYEPSELVGRNLREFVTEERFEAFQMETGKRQWGTSGRYETEMRHRDGSHRSLLVSASPLYDREDNYQGALGMVVDITERKRAEEALKESEEKFRAVVENAPNVIFNVDREGTIQFTNRTRPGTGVEEMIGKKIYHYILPEYHTVVRETIDRVFESGKPGRYEIRGAGAEGGTSWYDTQVGAIKQNGRVVAVTLITTDITERKRAEEALLESEEKYRLVSENIPVVVYSALPDEHSTNVLVTGRILGLTGYSDEQFMEDPELFGRIVHPEDKEYVSKKIEEHREKKILLDVEYRIITKDNTVKWIRDKATPMVDENGQIVRINGFMEDITERKRAEEELRLLSHALDSSADGVATGDLENRITYANEAFVRMFGYSKEELIGKEIGFIYSEGQLQKLKEALKATIEGSWTGELTGKRKNGELFPVEVSSSRVVDDAGKVIAHVASHRDIAERKKAEEAVEKTAAEWESTFNSITDLVSVHDKDFRFIRVNKQFADLLKMKPEELVGKKCYEVVHGRERPPADCPHKQLLESKKAVTSEFFDPHLGAYLQASASPMFDEDGDIAGCAHVVKDITERKRAEEALRESEERLKEAQRVGAVGDWQFDVETQQITWSEQVYRLFERDPTQGPPTYDENMAYYYPEDSKKLQEQVRRAIEFGEESDSDYRLKLPRGKCVYQRGLIRAIKDENGKIVKLFGTVQDITERKKAEEEVRGTKESYDRIIDNADEVIFRVRAEGGHVVYANPAAERLFGYSQAEWLADPTLAFRIIHPDFAEEQKRIIEEINTTRKTAKNAVLGWIAKDGRQVIVEYTIIPITDEEGKIVYFESIGRDITERKRAEEAIKRSEEQLRALFDSAADAIFTKDREGRYTRVNYACARLHGLSEEEFLGKTDFDLFPEEQAKHSADIDRQVLVEGRTFSGQYERQVKGKTLTFSVVKTPLHGPDGAIIGLCGIARDITEQESLEEQLRQAQKMESLGTLAGGVAHDFNNLLGGILGYVGLIKGDYSPGEKHYAMLELVEKASMRAAELTNQLLAFSRKGKYELRPVSLNNSVEDVLKLIGRTLDKNIEIVTELQEELPSVEGDPGQLEQAIINLCVNAAEAMPGGGKLQLETRVVALGEEFARKYLGSDPGDYVLLSVSDTGIGMDSETLSRMFEPFFTTKEMGKGTGLGLSTVYGIVKNHGGYVDVRSQPGKGSTFDIYLPVSKKQFTPPRPRAAELQTGHETILAVDDEEIIRSLLEETLQKLGYKVILANDGEEAVQIYEERKDEIDAVIIDMIMPHLGGRETFREIKRRNPDVRVLLVSGFSQDGAAQRILDEGVKGFIQKPFELVELSQKLRQVLA